MQTEYKLTRVFVRGLMGLVACFATTSRIQAQQYVYYPSAAAAPAQPQYYLTQPGANPGSGQPAQTTQPTQYYYTPQYYQPTQALPATDVVQTAYSVPTQTVPAQPAQAAPASYGSDPYGFLSWLNGIRASYGLGAVNYDANLSNWAALNNDQQQARGLGHFVMGPARRQNSAMGGVFPGAMWMASPAHRAALLDPTISWIGIAAAGAYWTFNAY